MPILFDSLKKIEFKGDWEIIFINDHSSDEGPVFIQENSGSLPAPLRVINLDPDSKGKKMAIAKGVKGSQFPNILVSDADCVLPPDFLHASNEGFKKGFDLFFGPVFLKGNPFRPVQELEQGALTVLGLGLGKMGIHVLGSGAFMGFKSSFFVEARGYQGNEAIASGDDMFLLSAAKRMGKKIGRLNPRKGHQLTEGCSGIKEYFAQKVRWAGKVHFLNDKQISGLGMLWVLNYVFLLVIPIIFLLGKSTHLPVVFIFGIRLFFDFLLVFLASLVRKRIFVLLWFIPAWILIFFSYPMIIGLLIFSHKTTWKERPLIFGK